MSKWAKQMIFIYLGGLFMVNWQETVNSVKLLLLSTGNLGRFRNNLVWSNGSITNKNRMIGTELSIIWPNCVGDYHQQTSWILVHLPFFQYQSGSTATRGTRKWGIHQHSCGYHHMVIQTQDFGTLKLHCQIPFFVEPNHLLGSDSVGQQIQVC